MRSSPSRDTKRELKLTTICSLPKVFRDALLSHLLPIPPNEYDTIATKLITAGSTLEFLKYSDALFEIVFVGGILQPGGSYVDDEKTTRSPFAIIGGKDEIEGTSAGEGSDWKDVLSEVRKKTDVLGKVIMRSVFVLCHLSTQLDISPGVEPNARPVAFFRYKYLQKPLEQNTLPALLQ